MFGQMIFAELPFAEVGNPPYVETGWIKVCKDPCTAPGWSKQERNNVNTIPCDQPTTNWTLIK